MANLNQTKSDSKPLVVYQAKCREYCSNRHCKINTEYVYSVVVYQKYLTRLGELIIFEPWRENYNFSKPRYFRYTLYDNRYF